MIPQNIPLYQEETASDTPLPTDTPTETETPIPTDTPSDTPVATDTPSEISVPTDTLTPTDTPVATETLVPTDTPAITDTLTPSDTPTGTEPIISANDLTAPDNDDFNNAALISTLPISAEVDTTGATTADDDPVISCAAGGAGQQSNTVWYAFTPGGYQGVSFDTSGSDYDTVIAVWRGNRGSLIPVACGEESPLAVSFAPGYTYFIEIAQSGDGTGGTLEFQAQTTAIHGLKGEYFDNQYLSGSPALTRMDPSINFIWSLSMSPAPEIPTEHFSVRWTGQVLAQYSETYTFYTLSDDGVRLWVDGQLLIDDWYEHPALYWKQADIVLQAGIKYSIRLEYFQATGDSSAELDWSSPSTPQAVIPTSALDYLDAANSTVTTNGVQPIADGLAAAQVTVTLLDTSGSPVVGVPVFLKASGDGNLINGYAASPDEWIQIGFSDSNGRVTGLLASTVPGQKTVNAMAESVELVPQATVNFLDTGNSTVTTDGVQPVADGESTAQVTVTLLDSLGSPVIGVAVSLKASGNGNRINGSPASPDDWIPIGTTDSNGVVTGLLASTIPGQKTIRAMAASFELGSQATVNFLDTAVRRVSVSTPDGNEADADSYSPSISNDGRRIAFLSWADNLVAGDANDWADVFLLDRSANTLTLASVSSAGGQAYGLTLDPKISGNGQFVVYSSDAAELVDGDGNGLADIFLYQIRDGQPGITTRVSVGPGGIEANGPSGHPSISYDGRYIVFESTATNLVAGGTDGTQQIFLYDRIAETTELISKSSDSLGGVPGNATSDEPSISANGQRVVFSSSANNLVQNDTNGSSDIFLRDRSTGETTRLSVSSAGGEASQTSTTPSISDDGNRVAFQSPAVNLVPGGSSNWQIYLRDIPSGTTSMVSVSIGGTAGNGESYGATISADGMHVVFISTATDLISGGSNGANEIFVRDLGNSTNVLISHAADGTEPNGDSDSPALSADGTRFVYRSGASNLVAGDELGFQDIFYFARTVPILPPANDDFDAALSIGTLPYNHIEGTLAATQAFDDPVLSCGAPSSANSNSVWFAYTPSEDLTLSISTFGSDYDTVLAVWTGTRGDLQEEACNDNSSGQQSAVTLSVFQGTQYWIEVVQNGDPGGGNLTIGLAQVLDDTPTPTETPTETQTGTPTETLTPTETPTDTLTPTETPTNTPTTTLTPTQTLTPTIQLLPVVITVHDTNGNPDVGVAVRAFDGDTPTVYVALTNAQGQATVLLPSGIYHFRANKNGTVFWSSPTNNCDPTSCSTASITTNVPVVVTVLNGSGSPVSGVYVYPYSGDTYLYISGKTNAQGQASFTLPDGSYRFRADSNGYSYWSNPTNNCPVPGCTTASISVFSWVTVTVHDTNGNPDVGVAVRAFDGNNPTVYVALTNAQGQAIIPIPSGIYHFRANKNGTVFWSSPTNNCDPTSCSTASITTDVPVVVTVLNGSGSPVSGVYVYPYSGDTYLYISGKTNAQGQASFTLPDGSYRFRADSNGHAYWSSTTNNCPVPGCTTANISTGTGAFAVSSSLYFQTCAITDFGAAKCWGDNISGQLGDGTTAERYSPVNVVGLSSGVKEIAVGIIHTCALTVGGGVKCWGDNSYGELGDGTTFNRLTPVDVVGLTNGITAIAAGGDFSCALTFTGGVKCWGWNAGGELGDGTCMNSSTPIDVSGLTSGVTSISAGFYYMCAVTSSGGAKCWGDNTVGQLGDGTTTHRCAPVDVYGLTSGVQSITTGIYHTCALTISGGVKCWGENPVGELGNGTYTDSPLPTDVVGLTSGITAIDAGDANTCALTNAGGLKCWGDNFNYQLGTGIGDKSNIPIDNSFFTANLKMVSVSSGLICVITNADKLKCWGHNWYGQVGNGTTDDAYSPVDVNLD